MKLRTRLFGAWAVLALALCLGLFWAIESTVESSFHRRARDSFARTRQSLDRMQRSRADRMREVCSLVMQIPELRALIAKHSYELDAQHAESLSERLDYLAGVVDAEFICALDANARTITIGGDAPGDSHAAFDEFMHRSEAPRQLLKQVFGVNGDGAAPASTRGQTGLWTYKGQLYQVVAVPLIFRQRNADAPVPVEGALIVGAPLTEQFAVDLSRSQNCEVSFMTGQAVTASSISKAQRPRLKQTLNDATHRAGQSFVADVGGQDFLTIFEPLTDPISGERVGTMAIQRSLRQSEQFLSAVSQKVLIAMIVGLLLAAAGSFLVSAAFTRPMYQLLRAVRRVGSGDLDQSLPEKRRDECGELAAAFNQMLRQLRARQDMERRMIEAQTTTRAKSEFLASMSHEIRTPMTAILGYADLMQDPHQSADDRVGYIEVIRRNGDHLLAIINDILDLSKIEAGEMQIERTACSPGVIMNDVGSLVGMRAAEKQLELAVDLEGPIPKTVQSDPTRLRQILINLVGNAIKFTDAGEVRMAASLTEADEAGARMLQFRVSDTGAGMTPEQMQRIFEPFSQADESTTRRFGGTGLGLSICRRMATLLGGGIHVDSSIGEGSVFTVTIDPGPLEQVEMIHSLDQATTQAAPAAQTAPPVRLHGHVLLAEDSKDNRNLLASHLRQAGADVTAVTNGQEACDAVLDPDAAFDLIFMDMQMPEMDGYSATSLLRQKGCTMPIIALTANAMDGDEHRCKRAGCTDYLSKPLARDRLIQKAAEHLVGTRNENQMSVETTDSAAARGRAAASDDDADPNRIVRVNEPASTGTLYHEPVDEAIESFLDEYIASLPRQVDELRQQLAEHDRAELAKRLHALKGSGGMYGFMSITDQAERAENAIKTENAFETIEQEVQRLVSLIRRVENYDPSKESPAPTEN